MSRLFGYSAFHLTDILLVHLLCLLVIVVSINAGQQFATARGVSRRGKAMVSYIQGVG